MNTKFKIFITSFICMVMILILLLPHLNIFPQQKTEFSVTAYPQQALSQALTDGKPVFLEFYAAW